LKELETGLLR